MLLSAFPLRCVTSFVLTAAAAGCTAQTGDPNAGLGSIARVSHAYYGGERLARHGTGIAGDAEDWIRARHIAVLHLDPAEPAAKLPIVLLPGYGIAASSYLETPDGREGWAMDFVRAGHPVYLVEPAHTTPAGIDTGFAHQDARSKTRQLFSWGGEGAWPRWGLGPRPGERFSDSRFPADGWEKVVSAFTGVEADRLDGGSQLAFQREANVRGLEALTAKTGPVTIVLHSASGVAAFEFARRHPERVAAIVAIEPVGCPQEALATPVLAVFGDHFEVREQMAVRQEECRQLVLATAAAGTRGELWSLPSMGVSGNSHLMMMEDNSRELSDGILAWLRKNAREAAG